ncbi:hypothetical protein Syun_015059 [Stephania yunnanensis]|uniref:Uncharacterized protein n=1 Tax=Stephania yunnanensis TaxID=152371 RepID=A0AAP0PA72_9MAGN
MQNVSITLYWSLNRLSISKPVLSISNQFSLSNQRFTFQVLRFPSQFLSLHLLLFLTSSSLFSLSQNPNPNPNPNPNLCTSPRSFVHWSISAGAAEISNFGSQVFWLNMVSVRENASMR